MPRISVTKPTVKASRPRKVKAKEDKVGKQTASKKAVGSAQLFASDGSEHGGIALSSLIIGGQVNASLLALAVRVYLSNSREGAAATKTRGEVEGSTRKIYRQKGTGRARHGAIRAPIFVGGGIVFGPKPRDYSLKLPKQMRGKALASALTSKWKDKSFLVIEDLEKIEPKTKVMAQVLRKVIGNASSLVVTGPEANNIVRAARNIPTVDVVSAGSVNAYDILSHTKLVITKPALSLLEKRLTG